MTRFRDDLVKQVRSLQRKDSYSRSITLEEAVGIVEGGMLDLLEAHKGFLVEGDYPFRVPVHYPGGVIVWPPVDIHGGAELGEGVMVGRYTNICGPVKVGDHTRIQGFCFIPDSVEIGSRVFIGPNVVFTNIKYPHVRSGQLKERDGVTVVEDGASIGAGAVICPGVRIGSNSLVGAGAVVCRDVPPGVVVVGCPAEVMGGWFGWLRGQFRRVCSREGRVYGHFC